MFVSWRLELDSVNDLRTPLFSLDNLRRRDPIKIQSHLFLDLLNQWTERPVLWELGVPLPGP